MLTKMSYQEYLELKDIQKIKAQELYDIERRLTSYEMDMSPTDYSSSYVESFTKIPTFKVKIIRDDSGTQYKKHTYESLKKFEKYGKDIFQRYQNKKLFSISANAVKSYCEIYQMTTEGKWIQIDIPESFSDARA